MHVVFVISTRFTVFQENETAERGKSSESVQCAITAHLCACVTGLQHGALRCRLIMHRRYRPIAPQKYYLLTNATNFAGPHLFTDIAVYATVIELCQ